jgi:hypothetical protein
MRNRKFARALGLSLLAALSVMAFTAVSAQAGGFLVNGAKLLAKIVGEQEGLGTLLVPGRNLKLVCHEGEILPGSEIISYTEALGKVLFKNCLAFDTAGNPLPCTPTVHETTAKVLPILHKNGSGVNEPYVLFEPDPTLFTIVLFTGGSCPLPEENPVNGTVVAKVDNNNTTEPLLLFDETIQLLIGDELKFGGFKSYIDGAAKIRGVDSHLNALIKIS